MSNIEELKQLEKVFPRWIVTKTHCYIPLTMTKESGHIMHPSWNSLSSEEVDEMLESCKRLSSNMAKGLEEIKEEKIDSVDCITFKIDGDILLYAPKKLYMEELKYKK